VHRADRIAGQEHHDSAQKNWAEHDLANGWGTLPDAHINLDFEPLRHMEALQWQLSVARPHTMLLARELLGSAFIWAGGCLRLILIINSLT
jgi:hypothetical protein